MDANDLPQEDFHQFDAGLPQAAEVRRATGGEFPFDVAFRGVEVNCSLGVFGLQQLLHFLELSPGAFEVRPIVRVHYRGAPSAGSETTKGRHEGI